MNFKKSLIMAVAATCLPLIATASDIDISKLSQEERSDLYDQMSEEKIFLTQILNNEKLKAAIATERESYVDDSNSENIAEDLREKLKAAEEELATLKRDTASLLEVNDSLRQQLNEKNQPSVDKSVVSRMFVTRIFGVEGDMSANIYFNNNFDNLKVGDEVTENITIDEISVDGVFIKIFDHTRVKLKEKSKKRSVMEGISIGTSTGSQSSPAMTFDPAQGFVPSAF